MEKESKNMEIKVYSIKEVTKKTKVKHQIKHNKIKQMKYISQPTKKIKIKKKIYVGSTVQNLRERLNKHLKS